MSLTVHYWMCAHLLVQYRAMSNIVLSCDHMLTARANLAVKAPRLASTYRRVPGFALLSSPQTHLRAVASVRPRDTPHLLAMVASRGLGPYPTASELSI